MHPGKSQINFSRTLLRTCVMPTNPPNSAYERLMKFLEANFLTQMVREPTRGSNTLDLLLTTKPQDVIEIQAQSTKLSDHKLVECKLSFNPIGLIQNVITQVDRHSFRAIDYHKADIAAMNLSLTKVDWNSLQRVCDECGDQDGSMFKELIVLTVLQISINHSPAKAEAGKGSKSRKEKELAALKMKKRKINRKLRHLKDTDPSSQKISKLELCASLTAYEIKDVISVFSDPAKADTEKCKSFVNKVQDAELSYFAFTPNDISEAIKELDPYSAAPDGDIPAKIICDCRDSLSLPLWMLWKRSLDTGVIPTDLKLQYITPIYKKGNRTEAVNYRPVSLTSHIIKIFERVVRKHLVKHLEDNNILPDSQHGFRKGRSCLTQLIEHVDSVLKALNDGSEVDVIYLDYSKAFDKVDHEILLLKIRQYGIKGPIYDWIKCFLKNRKQTVVVDGVKSTFEEVESGVPQGTVLGPVFFIVYVIDLVLRVKSSKMLTFADDTKLMRAITQLLCKTLLQADLDCVIQWSISNNMLLHEDKFVVVNYSLNAWRVFQELPFMAESKQYYTTSGKILEPSCHTRDLGVYLSDDCSWTFHINKMTAEARKMAAWALGAFRDRSVLTMMTLFN